MKGLMGQENIVKRVSVEELLEYLERNPNLLGWDAILVYDRNKTNTVLLQEYIKRFSGNSYLAPMTFKVPITPSVEERVIDYRLDTPRLSFENANLESSRVDLKMRIVGGKQLTIENPNNPEDFQITRLKMADALNGPVLHVRVSLEEVNVNVSKGRVGLDLNKGTEFYLTFADTTEEDMLGGQKFKDEFDKLAPEQKIFEISQLLRSDNLIKPAVLKLRTQPSPDTHLLGTPTAGDGAVLGFVGMEGIDEGQTSLPSRGFQYLLPNESGAYSANLIASNKYILGHYLEAVIEQFSDGSKSFKGEYRDGVLVSVEGYLRRSKFYQWDSYLWMSLWLTSTAFGFAEHDWTLYKLRGQLKAFFEAGELVVVWAGHSSIRASVVRRSPSGGVPEIVHYFYFDCPFSVELRYEFEVLDNGKVGLKRKGSNVSVMASYGADFDRRLQSYMDHIQAEEKVQSAMRDHLDSELEKFDNLGFELDLFLLNNMLFRGDQVFHPTAIHQRGALVTLGQLAPDSTLFQIDPVETVVGAGGKNHTFKTHPANMAVTWSVANLPGEEGDPGTIDANSGVYVSPPASALAQRHKRVIITARAQTGTASSRALVGIVTRDIGLDPIVMIAKKGVNGYKVRATPLDPAENLTFRMSPGALGTVIDDPDADPDVPYSKLYVPPATLASTERKPKSEAALISAQWLAYRTTETWQAEEDIDQLLAVEQVLAARRTGDTQEVQVLLPLKSVTNNWFTYESKGEGVQLTFWGSEKDGDYIVEPDATTWYLVKGAGTFANGLYTPAPNSDEAYAVVAAIEYDSKNWYWAFAILPVPFVTVENFVNMAEEART